MSTDGFDVTPTVELDEATAAVERLAVVRLLLQSQERDVKVYGIALATAFEYLQSGPKTTDEVLTHLRQQWPGVVLTRDTVDEVLGEAETRGYTAKVTTLGSSGSWQLAKTAELELEASRAWGIDAVHRCQTFLHDEARKVVGEISVDQAELWTKIVLSVLLDGVRTAFTTNPRGVVVIGDSLVFPTSYDLQAMQESVAEQVPEDDAARILLQSLVAAAMNPATPFGNEIVHYLATGYILYAYLGRHDKADARAKVGSLNGEVVILDTPILFRLLEDRPAKSALMDLITQAINASVEVRVHTETFNEMASVLDRVEGTDVPVVASALERGANTEVVAGTVGSQVIRAWLSLDPPSGERYMPWVEFRRLAKELEDTLRALGVRVEPGPAYDFARTSLHMEFAQSLKNTLARGGKGRGERNIDHDAQMLTTAYEVRKNNPANSTKAWPGAFVVTPDTFLSAAYEEVAGEQTFRVALSPGQWSGIIANCCDPVSAEALAQAISRETSYETLLARGASIPLEATVEVARALGGSTDVTPVEAEILQLTFDEVLSERPDLLKGDASSAQQLAAEALHRRRQRLEAALQQQRHATSRERERSDKEREVAVRVAAAKVELAEQSASTERAKSFSHEKDAQAERIRNKQLKRALGSMALGFVLIAVVGVPMLTGRLVGKGPFAAGMGLLAYAGTAIDFVRDVKRPLIEVLSGAVVSLALLGLGAAIGG